MIALPSPHSPARVAMLAKDTHSAKHKIHIGNLPTIAIHVRERLGVHTEIITWAGMPLKQQVELMARSDVTFSLGGSDTINTVFMPTCSAIVVAWRKLDNFSKHTHNGWESSADVELLFNCQGGGKTRTPANTQLLWEGGRLILPLFLDATTRMRDASIRDACRATPSRRCSHAVCGHV